MGRQARPPLSAWSSGATVTGVAEVLRQSEQHYRDSLAGEVLPRTGGLLHRQLRGAQIERWRGARQLIRAQPRPVRTITVDNGTEFHEYAKLERATGTCFYFATPHHAWERGTNENTNGLVRQYLPKRQSMVHLTQHECNRIATKLNRRPRKRLNYRTPEECYAG